VFFSSNYSFSLAINNNENKRTVQSKLDGLESSMGSLLYDRVEGQDGGAGPGAASDGWWNSGL
jgi:hypothetical protein